MKKTFAFIILMFTLFFLEINISATENVSPVLIEQHEEDITGNGLKEIIQLKGALLSKESNYYHSVWAEIIGQNSYKRKINYGGAYDPSLNFIDIHKDQVQSILFQSIAESDHHNHYYLHTLKGGHIHEVQLPKQNYISGIFKDNFVINLLLSPHEDPINIDVADRADGYIQYSLYNAEGKLLKEKSIITNQISRYEPVLISESNGFGLKSYQPISGVDKSDKLGEIETLWFFENGQWIILQSNWIPLDD